MRDTYYLILDNGNYTDLRLVSMDLVRKKKGAQHPTPTFDNFGEDGTPYRIHLDDMFDCRVGWLFGQALVNWRPVLGGLAGPETWFDIPRPFYSGSYIREGDLWLTFTTPIGATSTEPSMRLRVDTSKGIGIIKGDWTDTTQVGNYHQNFLPGWLGFGYDMELKLPQIYPTKKTGSGYTADISSNVTIHRCKFSMGPSGAFSVKVIDKDYITPRRDYTHVFESDSTNTFYGNPDNIMASQVAIVPVYQPNTEFKLEITSSNPAPCTLNSMTWEGDYNTLYRSA